MASSYPQPNYANYANGGVGGGVSPMPMTQYPTTQYPPTQDPTAQYHPTQYPLTQYPPTQDPTTQYPPTQYPMTQYPTASGADAQAHVQAPKKDTGKKRGWCSECWDWCQVPCCSCCYSCCFE